MSGRRRGNAAHLERTYLGEVLADVVGRRGKIVAKGASVSCLAGALAEELARDVGCICDTRALDQSAGLGSCNMAQAPIDNRGPTGVGQDRTGRERGGGTTVRAQDLLGGLRGPSKREAAGPGAIGWPGAPLGGMFRLPLRAWRYSGGMLEGRCVSRHQGEPLG